MVLPWILLLLFNAAILRAPLFFARDALLMTTGTLPTFVSGAPATVRWVICFSMFLWRCFRVVFNLLRHSGYYVYHQFC
jgi:hypothetical protein